jgi:hypothetical protein
MTPADDRLATSRSKRSVHWRRAIGIAAGVLVGVVLLHLPILRGALARFGGCPFANAPMTSGQMDTARRWALATRRGEGPAPVRPALGFSLDTTSENDVRQWAKGASLSCEDKRDGFIVCTAVPPEAIGFSRPAEDVGVRPGAGAVIDELAFGFNRRGQLVNVTTMRTHLRPVDASVVSSRIVSRLRDALGPATHSAGSLAAASLAQPGALGMATVSYRFRDYVAEMATMNLPSSGLSVREHYVSASD